MEQTPAAGRYGRPSSITSQDILDENASTKGPRRSRGGMKRKTILLLVFGVCAIAAAAVAYLVTRKGDDATDASNESGGSGNGGSTSGGKSSSGTSTSKGSGTSTGTGSSGASKVTTDPTAEKYPLTAFAIGDWGATTYSVNGSCCSRRHGVYNAYDRHSEVGVSKLMALEAANGKPAVVLSHGDNFYWDGMHGEKDMEYRFQLTFEDHHGEESMMDVPWLNVMGNHDYGGASFVCQDSEEAATECKSTDALISALKDKFDWQAKYTSPNNNRWILKDHFYKYSIEKDGVTMDIFNLDTNDADVHGADQVCCQCYGYAEGDDDDCNSVTRGHKYCCGGDTGMWDKCMALFKSWGDDSKKQLLEEAKKSTATWKIVNTHYSAYGHYGEQGAKEWMEALEGAGIQLWIAGHTHGEKHDYASFNMHFIENGAGGGIQSEPASGIPKYVESTVSNIWSAGGIGDGNTYGFFALDASETWLKARYMTFDDKWSITKDDDGLEKGTIGGVAAKHCWYIPVDGAKGQECEA
ncbi:hypothetical protein Poli38472_014294 [Pythium oligandrum]|uniref:Calcineurin-like phosphoesterase domain-containing protein n=1 Tax=Pythium oligandrum TaxID=41045 RepID=A0A8K1CIR0_PYTOL|nr:hypothetical protein Poli38472_014294 [Pythium oligandrum]|eukprot:TMW64177.1 hypothetical protein Poli38472_014294 [Pythium oligandrum]